MDHLTLGIRPHQLILYGAGSGVGKTEVLRHIVKHLVEEHGESVGVISTEDPYVKVARSFVGKWINKRIELPPNNDPSSRGYRLAFNYTKEEVDDVIDYVAGLNKLFFADLSDSRSIDAVMEQVEEFYTMGVKHIIIDNLVGIEVKEDGKGNEREGIDEALKTFGLYKDNKEVTIHLVSHLKTVGLGRTPHEEGGEVQLSDFRGSRAIGFWASYAIAVQRNTQADTIEEKTTTYIKIVKDRDQGLYTGEKVILLGQESTGNLLEPSQRRKSTTVDKTRTTEETNTDDFG
jgi:twinkle protein